MYGRYLIHFNPNHDPKNGRFTYKPGNTVLPKGMRLNSVSGVYLDSNKYKNNGRWMYTYRADEKWDNKVYKGPFSAYLMYYRGVQFIKEHEFETISDMKMPTRKEREDEFRNMLDDPKWGPITKKELENVRKNLIRYNIDNDKEKWSSIDFNNLKTQRDYKIAYDVFGHAMEEVHNGKCTQEYAKRMSNKWDAMVDDNNVGKYNNAVDPIIIFKADKFLNDVSDPKNPKYVSYNDIMENFTAVESELKKEGKDVLL